MSGASGQRPSDGSAIGAAPDLGVASAIPAPALAERLRRSLRDVPDFPRPGIVFKDLTPALKDGALLKALVDELANPFRNAGVTTVAAVEARGFLLGGGVADRLGAGLVPLRKPGKLPWRKERVAYDLEYGTDALEAHVDAFGAADRVLIVDDVLATGGTAGAAADLVRRLGAQAAGAAFLVELSFLDGRGRLGDLRLHSILCL